MEFLKKFFSNDTRNIKKYAKINTKVLEQKSRISHFTNKELELSFKKIKEAQTIGEPLSETDLVKMLSICSLASQRILGHEPFEVQLMGIQAILDNKIIEMKTGEGKTLVAGIAAIIATTFHENSFVVTVNDYLAKRDKEFMEPLCEFFNTTISYMSKDNGYEEKKEKYSSDIVYSTNSTLAFDYLKENLIYNKKDSFLNGYGLAIVDEIDSILIDEARTPLIISSEADFHKEFYVKSFQLAEKLEVGKDFRKELEDKNIILTEQGINKIEKELGIDKLYVHKNINWAHQILQSLQAIHFFKREMDYIVDEGLIKIIDEYNGRISEGRRWSNGLHQALEMKENVQINEDTSTLAEITYQSFFKLFSSLTGMSGTVKNEEREFYEIYNREIIEIPTNKPIARIDNEDLLFHNTKDKYDYLARKVKEIHSTKRPILIGTISVEQSEGLSQIFTQHNLKHKILNAKNHAKEADIIKGAGQPSSITIATNMAGRGVDIKLSEEVKEAGGLVVFGFERYQNRRIDNQLIGRSGRQGEPGESTFLLSLDDHILSMSKNPLYETLKKQLEKEKDGTKFSMLTKVIRAQQNKISNMNMEYRKNLYKYDKILSTNRRFIYDMRKEILSFDNTEENKDIFVGKIEGYIEDTMRPFIAKRLFKNTIAEIALNEFGLNIESEDANENELVEEIRRLAVDKIKSIDTITTQQIFIELLDKKWREFLDRIGNLKQGIHLRSYNQKDPVVEFQTEAQIMFSKLVPAVKIDIVKTILLFESENRPEANDGMTIDSEAEGKIIEKLEKNNAEIEEFLGLLLTENLDFEAMTDNYLEELLEDIVNEDFYNGISMEVEILPDFNISPLETVEAKNSTASKREFILSLKKTILERIDYAMGTAIKEGQAPNRKSLYKDIFVSSLENNHNQYSDNLKSVFRKEYQEISELLLEIDTSFILVYLNTKFDIIFALSNITELLNKKAAHD